MNDTDEYPPVDKASALEILSECPMSVRFFASRLGAEGFRTGNGPRKASKILDRLRVQGLVRRIRSVGTIRYNLPTTAGMRPVERRAPLVEWEVTSRGLKRLEWLQTRDKE